MEALIRAAMLHPVAMVTLQPDSPIPLVNQIVEGLRALIADQSLKADAKLPSIRAFAASHGVSVFTVVEAYDRLVAQGWLASRAHSGLLRQAAGRRRCLGGRAGTGRSALRRALVSQADLREPPPGAEARLRLVAATTGCSRTACGAACATWPPRATCSAATACPRPHGAAHAVARDAGRAPDRRHGRQRAVDAGLEPGPRSRGAPAGQARRRRAGRRPRLSEPDVHAPLPRRAPDRRAAHGDGLRPCRTRGAAGGIQAEGILHAAAPAKPDQFGGADLPAATASCSSPSCTT